MLVAATIGVALLSGAEAQASSSDNTKVAATAWTLQQDQATAMTRLGFFSSLRKFFTKARKVFVCVAHIVAFAGLNTAFVVNLRKAGGAWTVARRVLRAKSKAKKLIALGSIFGEVAGLNTVAKACGA